MTERPINKLQINILLDEKDKAAIESGLDKLTKSFNRAYFLPSKE